MAVGWGSLNTGSDMTISSTSWVTAQGNGATPGTDIEVQIAANEELHVSVLFDPPTSPTDDMEFRALTTLSASSTDWDTVPFAAFGIDNGGNTGSELRSVIIRGPYKVRFQGRLTGATDTSTFRVDYRKATLS